MQRLMSIWVMFLRLFLHYWGARSLSKIASAVRVPMAKDKSTTKKLWISNARVLVEVEVTQRVRKSVRIKEPDGTILIQSIEYEWLPMYSTKCHSFGHDCSNKEILPQDGKQPEQGKKDKGVWRPKVSESFEAAVQRASKASKAKEVVQPQPLRAAIHIPNDIKVQKTDLKASKPPNSIPPELFPSLDQVIKKQEKVVDDVPTPQRPASQAGATMIHQFAVLKNLEEGGSKKGGQQGDRSKRGGKNNDKVL